MKILGLKNLSSEPFFSAFRVSNPVSKSSYRVAIRGLGPGGNFCSCPDDATSELGTCKHIEITLGRLQKKRGAKTAFARGYQPAFSELYLRNDGKRSVHFRAGTDCPPAVSEAAAGLFDAERNGMLPDERLGELETGAGHQFRGKGHHRGGHAFGAGVQTLLIGRNSRRRQRRDFARRVASQPLHVSTAS